MYSLLLALIYLAFISLGLPDALLGSAWPTMYPVLEVPVSFAGIISMIIAGGTIVSSLNTNRVVRKFGTGLVTAVSVLMTAVALFGFSVSKTFWMLCLWSIPYGLGAGAVDSALNNFVALHYASRHMSWLHCFWGIGASVGPYIMSYCLTVKNSWESGYMTVGAFQIVLTVILFFSLPVWNKQAKIKKESQTEEPKHLKIHEALKIKGVKQVLIAFFSYCALETTAGLWASSYLVLHQGIEAKVAARWASLFYLGITFGRFLNGFVTDKLGNRNMIRIGLGIITIGLAAVILPVQIELVTLAGLVLIGIGCAPIYPCIIHETPKNFGAENSQAIIGIQMASAYTGSTFMPPIFGVLAKFTTISLYPVYLTFFLILMIVMTERLNRLVVSKESR
ncbi:MAG TPA: MFS transporter [Hungateiclostridium thermocellum]|uniref:Major facilitator superfamily MFS_1 n=1 Tax=Acetivibrio thermocellus (strain ATCC 27405 / DSM 1237 / JCM 9322 / NBRC 103400 / NCIMB 10682 / NRRL B-4536 / VPI 7372) TaxID=203119 RepID=A3DJN5_ACET2|nr:MFS transporter [Acetivibrio thermocellus]CDG37455.1 major facilitator transporter [Acetivibrio thermocellus BC1]ABN54164.1 major facilitator superfamily MFS_1 [Acetivibrio thermocellus ATCC 27405]NLU27419.1 MFS transporter [Acetivibrio thermocellus]THJ77812.1 MFS transporter [Acetivibrio thermocellus]UWV47428.1 MFS transporter [Acetivibrio thermocellus]